MECAWVHMQSCLSGMGSQCQLPRFPGTSALSTFPFTTLRTRTTRTRGDLGKGRSGSCVCAHVVLEWGIVAAVPALDWQCHSVPSGRPWGWPSCPPPVWVYPSREVAVSWRLSLQSCLCTVSVGRGDTWLNFPTLSQSMVSQSYKLVRGGPGSWWTSRALWIKDPAFSFRVLGRKKKANAKVLRKQQWLSPNLAAWNNNEHVSLYSFCGLGIWEQHSQGVWDAFSWSYSQDTGQACRHLKALQVWDQLFSSLSSGAAYQEHSSFLMGLAADCLSIPRTWYRLSLQEAIQEGE